MAGRLGKCAKCESDEDESALPPESVSQEFEFESCRWSQCRRRATRKGIISSGNAFINKC